MRKGVVSRHFTSLALLFPLMKENDDDMGIESVRFQGWEEGGMSECGGAAEQIVPVAGELPPPVTLEEARARLEAELSDSEWQASCPICSKLPSGSRSEVFAHMMARHGLDLGDPARIVDAKLLLATIAKRLEQCRCLCCERQFPSQAVLRKHMKHKKHYRISVVNPAYTRFFIASFEPDPDAISAAFLPVNADGENTIESENEDPDSGDDDSDDLFVVDDEPTKCLFCDTVCESAVAMARHCATEHSFDIAATVRSLRLSFYDSIKLINYIRSSVAKDQCPSCQQLFSSSLQLKEHLSSTNHSDVAGYTLKTRKDGDQAPWDPPQYLLPPTQDPLLYSLRLCGCVFVDEDDCETPPPPTAAEEIGL